MLPPPPLAWIDSFINCIRRATERSVQYQLEPTPVSPLLFRITINFPERISGKSLMLVWNLFQMYAAKNDCVPQGKAADTENRLVAEVAVKRRLGFPKNKSPE